VTAPTDLRPPRGGSDVKQAIRSLLPVVGYLILFTAMSAAGPLQARLADEIAGVLPVTMETYTYLHENPELGKNERKAHDFIGARLKAIGFDRLIASKEAPTAVIAVLDSGRPGPIVALRAELDARPLEPGVNEPAGHSPRSKTDGVMHNCGHDAHAAMLLGTAALLMRNSDMVAGKVVFLFQPAEETAGGADDIVHEKILSNLGVEKIFAVHSAPGLKVGFVSASSGASLAGSSTFQVTLKGRGSHAAAPYDGDDIPLLTTHLVQQLSYLPARRLDIANRPVIVSVTKIAVDGPATNVLPATSNIGGTVRAFEDPLTGTDGKPSLKQILQEEVEIFSKAHGITADFEFRVGSPPTVNEAVLFSEIAPKLAVFWPGTFETRPIRGMFSEDFAYYTKDFRSIYFGLGIMKDGLGTFGVHSPNFTLSPEAFPYGVRLLAILARIATTGNGDWE
jgi:amidohydrolase